MIKGVLFDMDGVLFDTERVYQQEERKVALGMGFDLTEEYLKLFCGMNKQSVFEKLAQDYPTLDVQAYHEKTHQQIARRVAEEGIPIKPHVPETLKALQARGIPVAVASSSKTEIVQGYLHKTGLAPYFGAVVGGDQIQNGKPAPDIFWHAAKQLGLAASDCAAVEDSHNGIRSAAAAGCVTVMIPDVLPPTDEMRQLAAGILRNMGELIGFIEHFPGFNNPPKT